MNAGSPPADLAIVSPLLIAVEGGFNDQGVRRKGSLVSTNGVIAVPIGVVGLPIDHTIYLSRFSRTDQLDDVHLSFANV